LKTRKALQKMKVEPLAFDSFGVRSMATYVETCDLKVLIDPAVALGPNRYRLPPHPLEIERLQETWADVKKFAANSDVLIITHYHYDHHNPKEPEVYRDKILYIKDPKANINKSQAGRSSYFLNRIKGVPRSVETADGTEFRHGSTTIRFSPAVCHGTNPRLGRVVEVSISCGGEKVVHTSDVEGPSLEEQTAFVLEEDPDLLILDGPMTYMLGFRYSAKSLALSIENINRIIRETSVSTILLDHHFMRDLDYKKRAAEVRRCAEEHGVKLITAAEYAGREADILEARRRELYG
jgi:predicted metallo-beta-lactamase superfamily hydrolase